MNILTTGILIIIGCTAISSLGGLIVGALLNNQVLDIECRSEEIQQKVREQPFKDVVDDLRKTAEPRASFVMVSGIVSGVTTAVCLCLLEALLDTTPVLRFIITLICDIILFAPQGRTSLFEGAHLIQCMRYLDARKNNTKGS